MRQKTVSTEKQSKTYLDLNRLSLDYFLSNESSFDDICIYL